MWEFFHSLSSESQRSFILVQLALAMAHLSLRPLTPRGWPVMLVMRGLLKMGCLRTSAWDAGSVFTRPTLTFNQEPKILFQNKQVVFLIWGWQRANLCSGSLVLCRAPGVGSSLPGASTLAKHIVYYKGEGGGFPQVHAVMSLMNLCLLVVHPNTKSAPTMH